MHHHTTLIDTLQEIGYLPTREDIKELLARIRERACAEIDAVYDTYNSDTNGVRDFLKNNPYYILCFFSGKIHKYVVYPYIALQGHAGNFLPTQIATCTTITEVILFTLYFGKLGTIPLLQKSLRERGAWKTLKSMGQGCIVGNVGHYSYLYKSREPFLQEMIQLSVRYPRMYDFCERMKNTFSTLSM